MHTTNNREVGRGGEKTILIEAQIENSGRKSSFVTWNIYFWPFMDNNGALVVSEYECIRSRKQYMLESASVSN